MIGRCQKIFTILRMLIFPATEICTELCCQSTWGHLPQLSVKFEPWMKHLSVLDMNMLHICPQASVTQKKKQNVSRNLFQ